MQRWRAVACGVALTWTGAGLAQDGPTSSAGSNSPKAVPLNYDLDAALTYIDALSRPGAAGAAGAAAPRTLGLRRLRAELDWQATAAAGLRVVLRPDAENQVEEGATPPRELDDRSGDPGMQPMPTVRLLDAYQLTLQPSPSIGASVGVWEGLAPSMAAYPELLGFGLAPLFPAKFSGLRLDWAYRVIAADTGGAPAAVGAPPKLTTQVFLFQGDEDRAETFGPAGGSPRTFDSGPIARDPYYGGAGIVTWTPAPGAALRLLAGYYDASYSASATAAANAATPPGVQEDDRHDQVFAAVSATMLGNAAGREVKGALDVHFTKDTRDNGIAARQQLSGMATGSVALVPSLWYLAGAGYGHGDRWTPGDSHMTGTVPMVGYQLETGVLAVTGQNLSLQFLVTHEWRVTRDATGASSGGFFRTDPAGQPLPGARSTVQRMGLELTYRLNQNA